VHVAPQLMPGGEEVTVPDPVPTFETVSAFAMAVPARLTVAVAAGSKSMVNSPRREPPPVGLNTTKTVHEASRASAVVGQFDEWPKSPEVEMRLTSSSPELVLMLRMRTCCEAEVVPSTCGPNTRPSCRLPRLRSPAVDPVPIETPEAVVP
jgi:hypothetical protein